MTGRNTRRTLGILGGLGPLASAHFYKMVTERTKADSDAENLNIIISSRADTPDRTAYIMGKSNVSPVPALVKSASMLMRAGADVIVIPCNTSHAFFDEIAASVCIPVISMIDETADYISRRGFHKTGIMGTDGTLASGIYKKALEKRGIEYVCPAPETQKLIMSIIYDYVKAGRAGAEELFRRAADEMLSLGCDSLILGCTELPLAAYKSDLFINTLEVLAYKSITYCGGTPCGFDDAFMKAYQDEIH